MFIPPFSPLLLLKNPCSSVSSVVISLAAPNPRSYSLPMTENQDTVKWAKFHIPKRLYVLYLLLPPLYILSIGPVAKFYSVTGFKDESIAEVVYFPLMYLVEHYPPARDMLEWYLYRVWRIRD